MITFYAFCRTVDDLADETDKPREERKSELLKWKNGIVNGFSSPDIIQSGVEELIDRYEIERDLFIELIKGMEMDFNEENYDTFEDLKFVCLNQRYRQNKEDIHIIIYTLLILFLF